MSTPLKSDSVFTPDPVEPAEAPQVVSPPLPDDVTLEIIGNKGTILGYVFCCASAAEGVTQEQRWLLYGGPALPGGVSFRPAGSEPFRSCATLEVWQRIIESEKWREGAWYVKVYAACYGDLQRPETRAPEYPSLLAAKTLEVKARAPDQQMVDREFGVFEGGSRVGDVHGAALERLGEIAFRNREHWVRSGRAEGTIALDEGASASSDVQAFLEARFREGSTLTIASCSYLAAKPANP